jgi:hypothetical protein
MNINLNNFWGNNSYNNPPINPDEISRLEIESGFTLPNLYKDLLLIQNGGYVNKTKFPTTITNSWSEDHTIFNYMFGIILDPTHKSAFNLCDNSCFINEWGYPNNVLIICTGGPYSTVLDYRKSKVPTVSWIDVDQNHDFILANNFDDFITKLV